MHERSLSRRKRIAVTRDRRERVGLLADVVLGVAEVLVLDPITNASNRPKSDATTPSICEETSASKPSRVAGTRRRIGQTTSKTRQIVMTIVPITSTLTGT